MSSSPAQQDAYGDERRADLAQFVPAHASSVLDVGCAHGGFAMTLRGVLGPDARLVGIEAVPAAAEAARRHLDQVYDGYFPDDLPPDAERFDLLCFNDVLEHMLDPWSAVDAAARHLQPGGRILASIPNVRYGPHLEKLWRGRWDYEDTGILDRTHVRFFTDRTIREMFEQAGYIIEVFAGINSAWRGEWRPTRTRGRRDLLLWPFRSVGRSILQLRHPDIRWRQFAVVAKLRSAADGNGPDAEM